MFSTADYSSTKWLNTSNRRLAFDRIAKRLFRLHLVMLFFGLPATALPQAINQAANPRSDSFEIALFTGTRENNPFWNLFTGYMKQVAGDLNLEIEVVYAHGDRKRMLAQVREACGRSEPPDAIVAHSFKRSGPEVLGIADRHNVPVVLVNSGLTEKETSALGKPRTKLRNWIGQVLPDDRDAGKRLAAALIAKAETDPNRLGPDGKVHVIALNGISSHSAAIERKNGLLEAIEQSGAVLDQIIAADWERNLASKRCRILLRRYPHASVIWSCSDYMAVGALEAITAEGLVPGKDMIVGGVDATPSGLRLVEDGTMHATIGGHFQEGGWVAAMLHDYLMGVDFADIGTQFDSKMILVTKNNIESYRARVTRSNWVETNFQKFSRLHNPDMKHYPFDMKARSSTVEQNSLSSEAPHAANASLSPNRSNP